MKLLKNLFFTLPIISAVIFSAGEALADYEYIQTTVNQRYTEWPAHDGDADYDNPYFYTQPVYYVPEKTTRVPIYFDISWYENSVSVPFDLVTFHPDFVDDSSWSEVVWYEGTDGYSTSESAWRYDYYIPNSQWTWYDFPSAFCFWNYRDDWEVDHCQYISVVEDTSSYWKPKLYHVENSKPDLSVTELLFYDVDQDGNLQLKTSNKYTFGDDIYLEFEVTNEGNLDSTATEIGVYSAWANYGRPTNDENLHKTFSVPGLSPGETRSFSWLLKTGNSTDSDIRELNTRDIYVYVAPATNETETYNNKAYRQFSFEYEEIDQEQIDNAKAFNLSFRAVTADTSPENYQSLGETEFFRGEKYKFEYELQNTSSDDFEGSLTLKTQLTYDKNDYRWPVIEEETSIYYQIASGLSHYPSVGFLQIPQDAPDTVYLRLIVNEEGVDYYETNYSDNEVILTLNLEDDLSQDQDEEDEEPPPLDVPAGGYSYDFAEWAEVLSPEGSPYVASKSTRDQKFYLQGTYEDSSTRSLINDFISRGLDFNVYFDTYVGRYQLSTYTDLPIFAVEFYDQETGDLVAILDQDEVLANGGNLRFAIGENGERYGTASFYSSTYDSSANLHLGPLFGFGLSNLGYMDSIVPDGIYTLVFYAEKLPNKTNSWLINENPRGMSPNKNNPFVRFSNVPVFENPPVYGCTDSRYAEYDANANVDDGTCYILNTYGCTDPDDPNYDPSANIADDSMCSWAAPTYDSGNGFGFGEYDRRVPARTLTPTYWWYSDNLGFKPTKIEFYYDQNSPYPEKSFYIPPDEENPDFLASEGKFNSIFPDEGETTPRICFLDSSEEYQQCYFWNGNKSVNNAIIEVYDAGEVNEYEEDDLCQNPNATNYGSKAVCEFEDIATKYKDRKFQTAFREFDKSDNLIKQLSVDFSLERIDGSWEENNDPFFLTAELEKYYNLKVCYSADEADGRGCLDVGTGTAEETGSYIMGAGEKLYINLPLSWQDIPIESPICEDVAVFYDLTIYHKTNESDRYYMSFTNTFLGSNEITEATCRQNESVNEYYDYGGGGYGLFGFTREELTIDLPDDANPVVVASLYTVNWFLFAVLFICSFFFEILSFLPFVGEPENIFTPPQGTYISPPDDILNFGVDFTIWEGTEVSYASSDSDSAKLIRLLTYLVLSFGFLSFVGERLFGFNPRVPDIETESIRNARDQRSVDQSLRRYELRKDVTDPHRLLKRRLR